MQIVASSNKDGHIEGISWVSITAHSWKGKLKYCVLERVHELQGQHQGVKHGSGFDTPTVLYPHSLQTYSCGTK